MSRRTDDCGRAVVLPERAQRVISLCPSLTETLVELGLGSRLVGRTRYCIHPAAQVESVADIGGTKQLNVTAIERLAPDLIIAEKEENRREDVERLAQHYPVYVLDIRDWQQAVAAITTLGDILSAGPEAAAMRDRIESAWQAVGRLTPRRRVLYLIWRKPWMVVGADTYINSVLDRLGLDNVAVSEAGRYPVFSESMLADAAVDLCLLSSEPFPFDERHCREVQALLPTARVERVDGEMFSWYGARMAPAASYLRACLARWG